MKYFILFFVTLYAGQTLCMQKKLITLNGHTASLIDHIDRSKKLMNTDPISATLILRYIATECLIERGNVLCITQEDLTDIKNDNYVYVPKFRFDNTHLSGNKKIWVDAIIVGTTDENHVHDLSPRSIDKILIDKREAKKKKYLKS
ncbi:MAG: hypothetical protein ACOYT8_03715 [Candidatus Dependentiae bacterium]